MENKIVAYHFLRSDFTSGSGNEPPWKIGEERKLNEIEIRPCYYGYHSSPTLFDALTYAPGPLACIVEISGKIIEHGTPIDKYVASSRKLLKAVNVEKNLRLFAADCAEHVLHLFEDRHPNDSRPITAIQAARDFANGKINKEQLNAAASAAGYAAAAAAGYAAAAYAAAADAAYAAAADAAYAASAAYAAANAADAASATSAASAASATSAASAASAAYAAYAAGYAGYAAAEREWQKNQFDFYFRDIFS